MDSCISKQSRIAITGASGFLGQHLVKALTNAGYTSLLCPTHGDYDLSMPNDVRRFYSEMRPQIVIHLAALVGGIGANQSHPAEFFYSNASMGLHLIEQGRIAGLTKFVCVGTVCAYPKYATIPFTETDLWAGYPEETNAPYGLAKKMALVQLQAYRKQYGFNGIYLLPVNLYGPGDNFDPSSSHVIPALILKCQRAINAGEEFIEVWGTGSASREFLYVEDAAKGLMLALERYNSGEPVNLGSGQEISIRDLAHKIAVLMQFNGKINWDISKPDGQPRRCLNTQMAEREFGFKASTSFDIGLANTIEWFRKNYDPGSGGVK
ncbi:MAG: GDP-L-fucose synthase [Oligoflexia bacterium]|nr:GDP-L-fucose synthase [Oligoflexia bacterium]